MNAHQRSLTWGLCVSTYERADTLMHCVRLALAQTLPPVEIVVVDASAAWDASRDRIAALVPAGVRLVYEAAHRRSLTAQRNQGVALARADVLFMIDDNSLMHPDCAEQIMAVYMQDADHRIAAVGAMNVSAMPSLPVAGPVRSSAPKAETIAPPERKESGLATHREQVQSVLAESRAFRFLWREVFLMAADRRFVRYDRPAQHNSEAAFDALKIDGAACVEFISGYAITVRRTVAEREPFDDGLVAYAAAEDLDATYRFSRHGFNVIATKARLHHLEAASGRIKRQNATTFGILNIAYFTRKRSPRPFGDGLRVVVMSIRMLLAELLKDLFSKRWPLPQVRGVLVALIHLPRVLLHSRARIQPWYEQLQLKILSAKG